MKYKVIKQHFGSKQYFEGDLREVANEADAKQLIKAGLIEDAKEAKAPTKKAAPKTQNKMAPKTSNKAK